MSDHTISNAAGWMSCGAFEKDTSPPGPAAQSGTLVHSLVEEGLDGVGPLPSTKEGKLAHNALYWLSANLLERWAEEAYAIDAGGSVRVLGRRIGRRYKEHGATDADLCGSADVVGPGVVVDVKTGREASYEKHEAQMRLLGYCAAKAQGTDRVRLVVLHVTQWGCNPHEREIDALDLGAIEHEIQMARNLPKEPRPGVWCEKAYCGARPRCPAYLQRKMGAA
jgi:hypothetical protein